MTFLKFPPASCNTKVSVLIGDALFDRAFIFKVLLSTYCLLATWKSVDGVGTIGLDVNVLIPATVWFPVRLTAVASLTVMLALPSKLTPFIVLAVANLVAVAELPDILPDIIELNVLIPPIVWFSVRLTALSSLTGTIIFAVPSNATPFIVLAVCSFVVVPAFPVTLPTISELNVLIPAIVWFPVILTVVLKPL